MIQTKTLPFVPLRGLLVLPYVMVHLDIGRESSINAIQYAMNEDKYICLAAQKNADEEFPSADDIYKVGTIVEVKQIMKLPEGNMRVLVEGVRRATILDYDDSSADFIQVTVEEHEDHVDEDSLELEGLTRAVVSLFEKWVKISRKMPEDAIVSVSLMSDYGRLADLISSHLNITLEHRQELLEWIDVKDR